MSSCAGRLFIRNLILLPIHFLPIHLVSPTLRRLNIMSSSKPTPREVIHAYRHLYRGLLHAVQFSMPARFTARDQLRNAFRKEDSSAFQQERIVRTIEFLRLAAQENGFEHRLVKNLLRTNYERREAYML